MAKNSIKFTCGCGKLRTDSYLEAVVHADSTGHTITALGTVKPDIPKPKRTPVIFTREE